MWKEKNWKTIEQEREESVTRFQKTTVSKITQIFYRLHYVSMCVTECIRLHGKRKPKIQSSVPQFTKFIKTQWISSYNEPTTPQNLKHEYCFHLKKLAWSTCFLGRNGRVCEVGGESTAGYLRSLFARLLASSMRSLFSVACAREKKRGENTWEKHLPLRWHGDVSRGVIL